MRAKVFVPSLVVVFIAGFILAAMLSPIFPTTYPNLGDVLKTKKELIDSMLEIEDLPSGYAHFTETGIPSIRTREDIPPEILDLGWIEGTRVAFAKQNSPFIAEYISRYPSPTVAAGAFHTWLIYRGYDIPEENKLGIGDKSIQVRVDRNFHLIMFTKGNLSVTVTMSGTLIDSELLVTLAQKAHSKLG